MKMNKTMAITMIFVLAVTLLSGCTAPSGNDSNTIGGGGTPATINTDEIPVPEQPNIGETENQDTPPKVPF